MDDRIDAILSLPRIGQFVSVGAVGATVETLIVGLLTFWGTVTPLLAKVIAAEISITLMFIINDRVTFSDEGMAGLRYILSRWGRSHAVRSVGLAVAFLVLWLLTAKLDVVLVFRNGDLWPTIANICGIGAGLSINYVMESIFTWRVLQDTG